MLHTNVILVVRSVCVNVISLSNTAIDSELLAKRNNIQCYRHFVAIDNWQQGFNLGLAPCQVALTVEGASASCKQCVMSIFHLPPQHPWGSRLEGRRLQSAGTSAFPTEKRHFWVLPSSTDPRWSCCGKSLSFWHSSETCREKQYGFNNTGVTSLQ